VAAVAITVELVVVHVLDALGVAAAMDPVDAVVDTTMSVLVLVAATLGHLEKALSHCLDLLSSA
jgi:hypothetical protein